MSQEILKKYAHQGDPCRHCNTKIKDVPPGPCVGVILKELGKIENINIKLENYEQRFKKVEFFLSHIYYRLQHHKLGDVRQAITDIGKIGENQKGIKFNINSPLAKSDGKNDNEANQQESSESIDNGDRPGSGIHGVCDSEQLGNPGRSRDSEDKPTDSE